MKIKFSTIIVLAVLYGIGTTFCIDKDDRDKGRVKWDESAMSSTFSVEEETKVNIPAKQETKADLRVKDETKVDVYAYDDFSEDLAWVCVSGKEGKQWGCIDKTGKMIFKIDSPGVTNFTPFSNGYAYIFYGDTVYIINTLGEITSKYTDEVFICAYGSGYTLIREHVADFDSAAYVYKLYNPNGSEINEFRFKTTAAINESAISYCGDGVFYISTPDQRMYDLFSASTETWIRDIETVNQMPWNGESYRPVFNEGKAVVTIKDYNSSEGQAKVEIVDINGAVTQMALSEDIIQQHGYVVQNGVISENTIVCSYGKSGIVSYNISDGSYVELDERYSKRLDAEALPNRLKVVNNRLALPLTGSDQKDYMAIFDGQLNLILEPVELEFSDGYQEGRLVVNTDSDTQVYDDNGTLVFKFSESYSRLGNYSSGVARVKILGEQKTVEERSDSFVAVRPKYLDKDGNWLFEHIDTQNIKSLIL